MKDQAIELLEKELADERAKNANLSAKIQDLSMVHHKHNSRINTAEKVLKKLAYEYTKSNNIEASNEISEITETIKDWSSSYLNEVAEIDNNKKSLPKTNVTSCDLLFDNLYFETIKNNIDFDLKINCSINNMIENHISKIDLETIIGDHIKDAIIAVTHTNNTNKCICATFDISDNSYEFNIYDSGNMFEIDTLTKLGTKPTTTHKNEGGSGFGFFNTFKLLNKYQASLHITELNFKNSNFSKCISFHFDKKNQYAIHSSRADEIKQSDLSHKILVDKLI